MLRSVWVMWAALACGVVVGCGGGGGNTGGSGGSGPSSSSSTSSSSGTGGTGGKAPACGDGNVDSGEACDDGNTAAGDGCDATCKVETGFECAGSPSVCNTTCGDGIVAGAEKCDDGNVAGGDGCDASCKIELGYSCTGMPSMCTTGCGDGIVAGAEKCDDGNMTDGDGCSAACAVEPGYDCGTAQPSICATVCGDGIVAGAEACDDGNTTPGDGCDDKCAVEVGYDCGTASPSVCGTVCGDGIIAGAEACDDSNKADGDGCSAACGIETGWVCAGAPSICSTTCGDGIIAGTEVCDDGNTAAGDGCDDKCAVETGWTCNSMPSSCTTTCGDGVIAGKEKCDDGNATAGDGCDAACAVEVGYVCTGAPSACATVCGDGIIAGQEKCDDGNTTDADGCSAACLIEAGYACTGAPSACAVICGDGFVVAGKEACDDGNTASKDGCSATCTVELGFTCAGSPSLCVTTCGDGIPAGAETCDDGNTANGDGCSSSCTLEMGYGCSGAPSVCGPVCGDGLKMPGEKCDDGNVINGDCCSSTCQIEPGCEIEPNDTIATANDFFALASNGKIKGLISPTSDHDVFAVVIPPGNTGNITAATLDGPAGTICTTNQLDSYLTIYNASGTSLGTDDDSGPGYCSLLTVTGLSPGTYYVEVRRSTAGATTFDYTLQVTLQLAVCGNGIVELSEQCDDGNTVNGDGCTNLCKLEAHPEAEPNNSCAAANGPYTLPPNVLYSGSINPAGDSDWYKFTLTNFSDVRVETFDANGPGSCASIDTKVQAFNGSCTSLGALDDDGGINACSLLDPTLSSQSFMRHLAPGTYYVQVTPFSSTATFNYTVLVSTVALCGNGVKEGSEQCDGTALCGPDCMVIPGCGNGVIEAGEQCDDGNTVSNDGCSATCQYDCPVGQTLVNLASTDVPKAIPDNNLTGITSVIPVSTVGTVQRVFFTVNITHTWDSDVDIYLVSPGGTTLDISTDNGSSNDNYTNTTFDDACTTPVTSGSAPFSGCYKPETPLSGLIGQPANGTWTLKIDDDAAGDTGTLNSWSISMCVQ